MIPPDLPAALQVALDARLHGLSRNDGARRAAAISRTYRSGGTSAAIAEHADALAYATARMPATYAAMAACLNALRVARPDFAPKSMLDIGAGTGAATWAAAESFTSLESFALIDSNAALRTLAIDLAKDSRLRTMRYAAGDVRAALADAPAADLVIASYVVNEIDEASGAALADAMWRRTADMLVIVEPGTPAGTARVLALRRQLIAQGASVAAPCPHDGECPLVAPDWCHFTQRLPRLRAHMALKDAELPYEDEKFTYVVLSRTPNAARPTRVLAQPVTTKVAVTAKLCTAQSVVTHVAPRRDSADYARFHKLRWGDAIEG